jgi:hypothetical protein
MSSVRVVMGCMPVIVDLALRLSAKKNVRQLGTEIVVSYFLAKWLLAAGS